MRITIRGSRAAVATATLFLSHAVHAQGPTADGQATDPKLEQPATPKVEPSPTATPIPPDAPQNEVHRAAADPPTIVRSGMELFAQYSYRRTSPQNGDATWHHAFEVPRIHGFLEGERDNIGGRLLLEAVRSSSDGALLGVSGDSLVLRVREAYGSYKPLTWIEGRAGVVPTFTINELDAAWSMRAVALNPIERAELLSPADLGATLRAKLPKSRGWVGLAGYNGEGYARRELNRGKNIEGAALIHPIESGQLSPFAIFASYVVGSSGVDSAKADRLTAALLWKGERVRAGLSGTYAWGSQADGTLRSAIGDAFVRVEPIERLLVGARASYWARDTAASDSLVTVDCTVGFRFAKPFEAFVAGTQSIPSKRASDAIAGSDFRELRLVTRFAF